MMRKVPKDRHLDRPAASRARARARALRTATQRERLVERLLNLEAAKAAVIAAASWFPGTGPLVADLNRQIRDLRDEKTAVEALRGS